MPSSLPLIIVISFCKNWSQGSSAVISIHNFPPRKASLLENHCDFAPHKSNHALHKNAWEWFCPFFVPPQSFSHSFLTGSKIQRAHGTVPMISFWKVSHCEKTKAPLNVQSLYAYFQVCICLCRSVTSA